MITICLDCKQLLNFDPQDVLNLMKAGRSDQDRRTWWYSLRAGDQVWTNYPFYELGEPAQQEAPWKTVTFISYDHNKYAKIRLPNGVQSDVKIGYLFPDKETGILELGAE